MGHSQQKFRASGKESRKGAFLWDHTILGIQISALFRLPQGVHADAKPPSKMAFGHPYSLFNASAGLVRDALIV
jgi:hypothetical protein